MSFCGSRLSDCDLLSGMKNASSSSCHLPFVGGLVLQKGAKMFP